MKATKLAHLYNTSVLKANAIRRLRDYFTQQFSVLIQKYTTNQVSEQAKLYVSLRIKWMALCLRTNLSEKYFAWFMRKSFPYEVNRIQEYLKKSDHQLTIYNIS